MSLLDNQDIPIGLGMALAQNMKALEAFSSMNKSEQQQVIAHTHELHSKTEMQNFVSSLSKSDSFH